MHTISIEFQPTMIVDIHNQCSNYKLIDQKCFNSGADWNNYSAQEADTEHREVIYFTPLLATFEGGLTYQLQRKCVKSDGQPESTYVLLFVAWKSKGYREFCACLNLIECDRQVKWNETKLEEYYQKYANQLCTYIGPIKDTWLIHGTVLMTKLELDFARRDGVLKITISKGIRTAHTRKPVWINLER
jgi:hypothetical protein